MNTYTVRTWNGAHATQIEAVSARDAITQVFGVLSTGHRVVDTDEGTFLTYSDDEGTREIAHVTTTYRVVRRVTGWSTTVVAASSNREAWALVAGSTAGVRFTPEGSGITVRTVSGVIGRILA